MILCIYHGNCADGFGAAWVVKQALGDAVDFHAGVYQQPPPDVTGKDVLLVDFSYKRSVLLHMAELADTITIIDHHKTAEADLVDLPDNVECVFDMNRSGAMMTWDYFFPDADPPQLLKHIEDRDLWRFDLPGTREIQACIFSHPYDFDVWDRLMAEPVQNLVNEGLVLERKHNKDIRELLGVVQRELQIGGWVVPAANLPYTLASDAGNIMAKGHPFAACYMDTPNGRTFSLRSTYDDADVYGVDVSEIAKLYGGGGHRNAAGFCVSFDEANEFEV